MLTFDFRCSPRAGVPSAGRRRLVQSVFRSTELPEISSVPVSRVAGGHIDRSVGRCLNISCLARWANEAPPSFPGGRGPPHGLQRRFSESHVHVQQQSERARVRRSLTACGAAMFCCNGSATGSREWRLFAPHILPSSDGRHVDFLNMVFSGPPLRSFFIMHDTCTCCCPDARAPRLGRRTRAEPAHSFRQKS